METRAWLYLPRNSVLAILSLISSFLASSEAEIYSRCEIAHLFQQNGLDGYRGYNLADWVCLAYYASGFNTASLVYEADRSTDSGIFQINSRLWCNDYHTPMVNKCKIQCNDLLNTDLKDDIACAMRIARQPQGLASWETWKNNCQGKDLGIWIDGCFS
ncbi:sperm acrosome membrane-associated protein 3 [Trichosurus vulpecula]|uniref:sperm acrosome membrane-associated protein 3 n=1 Tax=Trichosurus vulpecula TaxID=9337 RepID=UPI00186AF2B0|nr:sperm acrosome membrane-associated protein 3 [Trichosurus vulpecula]